MFFMTLTLLNNTNQAFCKLSLSSIWLKFSHYETEVMEFCFLFFGKKRWKSSMCIIWISSTRNVYLFFLIYSFNHLSFNQYAFMDIIRYIKLPLFCWSNCSRFCQWEVFKVGSVSLFFVLVCFLAPPYFLAMQDTSVSFCIFASTLLNSKPILQEIAESRLSQLRNLGNIWYLLTHEYTPTHT